MEDAPMGRQDGRHQVAAIHNGEVLLMVDNLRPKRALMVAERVSRRHIGAEVLVADWSQEHGSNDVWAVYKRGVRVE